MNLIHIGSDVQQPVRNKDLEIRRKCRYQQEDQKESDFRIICIELKSRLWEKTKSQRQKMEKEKEKNGTLKRMLGYITC